MMTDSKKVSLEAAVSMVADAIAYHAVKQYDEYVANVVPEHVDRLIKERSDEEINPATLEDDIYAALYKATASELGMIARHN